MLVGIRLNPYAVARGCGPDLRQGWDSWHGEKFQIRSTKFQGNPKCEIQNSKPGGRLAASVG
jgi:hypothetical protein